MCRYINPCDEDMTHINKHMKVKDKVSSFLCLYNNINKNLLLPNIGTFNVFRENLEDSMNLGETSYVASITHGMWMHHVQDPTWGARTYKHNI